MDKNTKKEIKFLIIGLAISIALFAIALVVTAHLESINALLDEASTPIFIATTAIYAVLFFGSLAGLFVCVAAIIPILFVKYEAIKRAKNTEKLKIKIESKLTKGVEFPITISITNENRANWEKLLCENLRLTALFDGELVHIKVTLPKEVHLETDLIGLSEYFHF